MFSSFQPLSPVPVSLPHSVHVSPHHSNTVSPQSSAAVSPQSADAKPLEYSLTTKVVRSVMDLTKAVSGRAPQNYILLVKVCIDSLPVKAVGNGYQMLNVSLYNSQKHFTHIDFHY